MKKIKIKRNTNGDSRSATTTPTIDMFDDANRMHIKDVGKMMDLISNIIAGRGINHDWSKIMEPHRSIFYRDLCNTIEGRMKFEDGEWYKFHCDNERHHLLKRCPEDVNLIDVIEMICDCVCAGVARSGYVRDLEINTEILERAVKNTTELLKNIVELED